jgi:hypothetical protein
MIELMAPSRWSLTCPDCGEPEIVIEIPLDAEPGTGIASCSRDHEFLFQFDGLSVGVLGFSSAQARRI